MLVIFIAIWIVCGIVCSIVASLRKSNPYVAFLCGVLFGPLGLAIAFALPQTYKSQHDLLKDQYGEGYLVHIPCGKYTPAGSKVCQGCGDEL